MEARLTGGLSYVLAVTSESERSFAVAGGVCGRTGGRGISGGLPVVRAAAGERFARAGVQRVPELFSSHCRRDLFSVRATDGSGRDAERSPGSLPQLL